MLFWQSHRMKTLLISLLFLGLSSFLLAQENLTLAIKYIGLTAVNVTIVDDGERIITTAKAYGLANLAAKMDNKYISAYSDQYLTTNYTKYINQKGYQENRQTLYDREAKTAFRENFLIPGTNISYLIMPASRDFFSALFYLRKIDTLDSGYIWLDANRSIWKANYKLLGREEIKTIFGKKSALKVELSFQKVSPEPKENTDMLTNNLVDEEKSLVFWFSDDAERIPLRAEFSMKPFPVVWELLNYEK